jgi:hypothetical protein
MLPLLIYHGARPTRLPAEPHPSEDRHPFEQGTRVPGRDGSRLTSPQNSDSDRIGAPIPLEPGVECRSETTSGAGRSLRYERNLCFFLDDPKVRANGNQQIRSLDTGLIPSPREQLTVRR